MHFNWTSLLSLVLFPLMYLGMLKGTEFIVRHLPRHGRLYRLVCRERLWCAKRGGNWWRGGVGAQEITDYARTVAKDVAPHRLGKK